MRLAKVFGVSSSEFNFTKLNSFLVVVAAALEPAAAVLAPAAVASSEASPVRVFGNASFLLSLPLSLPPAASLSMRAVCVCDAAAPALELRRAAQIAKHT
jgi:hypothetical protein